MCRETNRAVAGARVTFDLGINFLFTGHLENLKIETSKAHKFRKVKSVSNLFFRPLLSVTPDRACFEFTKNLQTGDLQQF